MFFSPQVSIAKILAKQYRIREKDIVILSQYNAQCAAILKTLESKGLNEISVRTVIASQGEYCLFKFGAQM